MKNRPIINKRPFLLLEVLIAFLLIVLCAIPLISPHVAIFRDQKTFIEKIEVDHAVAEVYGNMIEQIYRQAIPWETLSSGQAVPIDKNFIVGFDGRPLPYEGTYVIKIGKKKPDKEEKPFSVNLLQLTFTLKSTVNKSAESLKYSYDIFLPRQLSGETAEEDADKDKNKNKEKPKEGEQK